MPKHSYLALASYREIKDNLGVPLPRRTFLGWLASLLPLTALAVSSKPAQAVPLQEWTWTVGGGPNGPLVITARHPRLDQPIRSESWRITRESVWNMVYSIHAHSLTTCWEMSRAQRDEMLADVQRQVFSA